MVISPASSPQILDLESLGDVKLVGLSGENCVAGGVRDSPSDRALIGNPGCSILNMRQNESPLFADAWSH